MKIVMAIVIVLIVILVGLLIYVVKIGIKSIPPSDQNRSYAIKTHTVKERDVFIITPKEGKKSDLTILYLHGGAYALGLEEHHWDFFDDLIKEMDCTIVVPDYPLVPKGKYQDVYDMIVPIYLEMIKKIDKKNFVMMGDSAGGGIALGLAEKMGEEGSGQPNKLILISPWLDVKMTNAKIDEVQKKDHMLLKENLKILGELYADKEGLSSYLVNPIDGPLEKLENVTILTGTYDILNPDVWVLQQKAKKQGIDIEVKETHGAPHIWAIERHKKGVYKAEEGYRELIRVIKK